MRTKAFFSSLSMALCLLLAGCSLLPAGDSDVRPGNGDANARKIYSNNELGFSFLYEPGRVETDNGTVTVYAERDGSAPYVRLTFTPLGEVDFNAEGYIEYARENLCGVYGDDLLEMGDAQRYDVADRALRGIRYVLRQPSESAHRWFLVESNDAYVVQYECGCAEGDEALVMETLALIVGTLCPNTDARPASTPQTGGGTPGPLDPGSQPSTGPSALGSYTVTPNTPLVLPTSLYKGGFFSLQLPVGWVIETTGAYTLFGFHAYDPHIPARQIFFYCKHQPLLKNMAAKQYFERAAAMVSASDPYGYHQAADTPVLLEPTTDYFFYIYNAYNAFVNKYGLNHQLPVMDDISILEKFPNSTPTAPNTLDNSIVRASFYSADGVACEGLMAGQVVNYGTDTVSVPGIDMGSYAVYNCNGVIAPADEFGELREQLMACLASFTFTEEYIRETQKQVAEETAAILAMSRSMQAGYDSYNAAWRARQTVYDIASQKSSDATLGYDRLYDPDTGEIYRAELGFYDDYDLHRDAYDNPDLQIIDNSTESYYLDDVDYYITK